MTLRKKLSLALDPKLKKTLGLSPLNKCIVIIIFLSLLLAIFETEPTIYLGHEKFFFVLECLFTLLFAIEYVLRVWVSIENPLFKSRLHYIVTPAALLDLLTVILILLTIVGTEGFVMRLGRLLRVLLVAKLGRYSQAIDIIGQAVYLRRFELMVSFLISICALILSSSILYIVEGQVQPADFGSIPRAMWWSIITLTTVGYGDVHPITAVGKIVAAITAVIGIGLIAIPTGILASSFNDAIHNIRSRHK